MKQLTTILLVLMITLGGTSLAVGQDSVQFFSQTQFFDAVRNYHPTAQSAALLDAAALEGLKIAKAGFDPRLSADWQQKRFNDKQYYNLWRNSLDLPTYYGLELNAGYDFAAGEYVNDENTLPQQGLGYLGISANLLQGLMIDERRTNLRRANIDLNAQAAQRQIILNNLLYEAGAAYWEWVFAYNQFNTLQRALALAEQRFVLVKQNVATGELPAIDTLDALLQVQSRQIDLNEAQNDLQNTAVAVANFLWENGSPRPFLPNTAAPNLGNLEVFNPNFAINEAHPDLMKVTYKLDALQAEERLKREKLKPKLKLKYNFLGEQFDIIHNGQDNGVVLAQNYKAGISFEMNPILRAERAELQLNKIKTEQTNFELINKRLLIQNKLNAVENDFANNQKQIELTRSIIRNYQALLNGEIEKFKVGESSLFVINTRETKLIEAEIKLLKLLAKQQKINLSAQWANGLLAF